MFMELPQYDYLAFHIVNKVIHSYWWMILTIMIFLFLYWTERTEAKWLYEACGSLGRIKGSL